MQRTSAAILAAVFAVGLNAQSPTPAVASPPAEHFDISGIVVDASNAKPVPRAQVTVQGRDNGVSRATSSDASGAFVVNGLPAGIYDLAATKHGYAETEADSQKVVLAGQTQNNRFTLKLQPQAVLSGTVLNQDGDPVVRAEVRLLRSVIAGGHRQVRVLTSTTTDDRGAFRFYGLEAGRYYAAAFAEAKPSDQQKRQAYAPAMYPNADNIAGAQALDLRPDAEQQIGITMSLSDAFRIRGKVVPPRSNVDLRLRPSGAEDEALAPPVATRYNGADGTFEMRGVPPGDYLVSAVVQDAGGKSHTVYRSVSVGGADISDVSLDFGPIAPLAGTVKVNGEGSVANAITAVRFLAGAGGAEAPVAKNGAFTFGQIPPGHFWLSGTLSPGWYIQSATQGGVDVLANGLTSIGEGFPTPLEIVVSPQGGSIEATVTWPDSGARPPARVVVLQQHGAELVDMGEARVVPGAEPTSRSALIGGLAPGDYMVYAFAEPVEVEYANPEALSSSENAAGKVTVSEGQRAQVTVAFATQQ